MRAQKVGPESAGDAARLHDLQRLYDDEVSAVYRYVHCCCRDTELAEDVTQDVFLQIARRRLDPATITPGWLKASARNRLIDILRRRESYMTKLRLIGERDASAGPEREVIPKRLLENAMARLPHMHRVVLMLHYVDGLTVSELAANLGRSPRGAESLITRARAALKKELEERDG